MRYEILGPLRVVDSAGSSFLSAPKIEILLAAMLIRANQPTSVDQLIAELWLDKPPRRAVAGLHVYVSQLRKFLDRPGESDSSIVTRSGAYVLQLGKDRLDSAIFVDLIERGRECVRAGLVDVAVAHFEQALELWRGDPLGDLPHRPVIGSFLSWVTEKRLECIELAIGGQMQLGKHREMIARLYGLIAEYPFREAFYRQLMLALYRSERQADALKLYQTVRDTLRRELGVDPGRSLQELQQAILTADRRLDNVMIVPQSDTMPIKVSGQKRRVGSGMPGQ